MKTLWEKEKLLIQAIFPFPAMFSTLSKTEIIISVAFNLSSADAFNLVWSKILLCGNGLIYTVSKKLLHTLPNDNSLDWTKFKAFADNRLNVAKFTILSLIR